MQTNGIKANGGKPKPLQRAEEADDLITSVKDLIIDFIRTADNDADLKAQNQEFSPDQPSTLLKHNLSPQKLQGPFNFSFPSQGLGREGLLSTVKDVQKYSVNTWNQGFLDKLYATPTPVGLAADLLLSSLNTNVHIYQVSPALTLIEKRTCQAMARMFGFNGLHAGGVSQSGGSAANQTSMVVARNNLFPETKAEGYGGRKFVLFTSEHGHYSVEKASQMFGFGSKAVKSVAVDERGCMRVDALEETIMKAKNAGETPFYVNATAGTTVLGSFDPMDGIAEVCKRHGLWMHVDGSWGGAIVFSDEQKWKLKGIERADSIALCPHKMMNVPLSCSLLLGKDLREFHKAMTLPAGYLFHANDSDVQSNGNGSSSPQQEEFWDLGDLTPQCGRRGDSLKLALSWIYYGTEGYRDYIDHGFEMAAYLASSVVANSKFSLLSEDPPPCLQVCFYYDKQKGEGSAEENSRTTERIKAALLPKGFMIDYAPGPQDGKFFRVVVNGQTRKETVDALVRAIEDAGSSQ